MIQDETVLKVCDNTGAQAVRVITVFRTKFARVGAMVSGAVHGATGTALVPDHSVVRAVIVRAHKEVRRDDGSYIRFDDNACVIVDKKGTPRGSRIFGPVAREVREAGFTEVSGLARELI